MRRLLLLVLLLLAASAPAAAQFPDPREVLRILLPRRPVETQPAPPAPPPPAWNGSRERPGGYQVLTSLDRPCHLAKKHLPFCVFSPDPGQDAVVAHAVSAWNQAGLQVGLGPLFERVTVAGAEDVRLDWSRNRLPEQAVAATWWDPNFGYRRVQGITIDPDPSLPPGNRSQVLMQELGHVLGLDHSDNPADMMYRTMHTRRYPSVDAARPSGRDLQALAWLYDQAEFVPIVGLRDRGGAGVGTGSGR